MTLKPLSPGKWRGLKATSSPGHTFSILAFDQRGSYHKMLPEGTPYQEAVRIKRDVVVALSSVATAVLLDPVYGLQSAQDMAGSSGLLMALEKTGYSGEATARRIDFMDGWDVAKIKRMGASGVKLLAYYHPDAGELTEEIENTIQQVAAACQEYDISLFVEPMSYSLDTSIPKNSAAFAQQLPRIVQETARRLGRLGVDVLKLEFPVDVSFNKNEAEWRAACEALTEASPVPWALLSAGVDYDTFERQVKVACVAGASGIIGGRAIWKECVTMSDADRETFLRDTATRRMQCLRDIVEQHGRPWTDYYTPLMGGEDWYVRYS
jgi:tagatose 1,6-diphosphate aldolase